EASFAILLLQDLAIVPLLALVPLLAGRSAAGGAAFGLRLAQVTTVLAAVIIAGRWVLPFVLRRLDDAHGFVAVVLLAILRAALGADWAGLSMALGAFVLGMQLSGSAFQQRIEAIVGPLKHALLDLFFIAVGMSLDVGLLAERGAQMAVSVVCILALKAATLYAIARWFQLGHGGALRMAAIHSQAGEFGFVPLGAAQVAGVIDDYEFNIAMLGIGVSMTATPLLLSAADALVGARIRRSEA